MKKYLFAVAFATACFGGPVGNPFAPSLIQEGFFISKDAWMNFRIGYEGNFVSDARMKQKQESQGRVDDFSQTYNSGTFTLNFLERIDLFGVFGSARMEADWRISPPAGATRIEVQSHYRFIWAAGGKILLFDWGNTGLSMGGRYTQNRSNLEWLTSNGALFDPDAAKFRYYQWQADLSLAHKINIFIPYAGVKFSRARARIGTVLSTPIATDGGGVIHMRNRDLVGAVIGVTLTGGQYFMLNIEGRFVDEEAFSVMGEFRF
jgi:hypothetical protein